MVFLDFAHGIVVAQLVRVKVRELFVIMFNDSARLRGAESGVYER